MKHNFFIIISILFCLTAQAQRRAKAPRQRLHRVVSDKQYVLKADSANYSAEFFLANTNTWTGDNYGIQPSFQFMLTYDNNKNIEFGTFACFNYQGFNGGNSNGVDIFLSTKLSPKLSLITDVYTYLNRRDTLINEFGYTSGIYNVYTTKLKYDFTPNFDVILGYSIFNNTDSIQHSMTLELDYTVADILTFIVQYNTGPHIFNWQEGSFAGALGFAGTIKKFKIGLTFNPFFEESPSAAFSPVFVVISRELSFEKLKRKMKHK